VKSGKKEKMRRWRIGMSGPLVKGERLKEVGWEGE